MNEEKIVEVLFGGGPWLIGLAAVLWFLMPVRAALIDWIKRGSAVLLLALSVLALPACTSFDVQFAEAVEQDRQTVGAEWWEATKRAHDAGEMSDEDFARRERKWFSMAYRNGAVLKRDLAEPGAPTPTQLAKATAADLELLGNEPPSEGDGAGSD